MRHIGFGMMVWLLAAWMPCRAAVLPAPDGPRSCTESALKRKAWAEAEVCFRRWVEQEAGEAARYFETAVPAGLPCRPGMARRLGEHYRQLRDYPRAFAFFRVWLECDLRSVDGLLACADMKVMDGREDEALPYYEQVLQLDADNRPANLFVGNYLFARAEAACRALKQAYEGLASPTKMDYARYREQLNNLVQGDYARAKAHLMRVASQFRSQGIGQVLERIRAVEEENRQ